MDATATEVAKLQDAAASRGYAAGSRDGAREMRLAAARLVEAAGCVCGSLVGQWHVKSVEGKIEVHDPRCTTALAEAIRRLPDGGAAEATEATGEGPLAGWGGGS